MGSCFSLAKEESKDGGEEKRKGKNEQFQIEIDDQSVAKRGIKKVSRVQGSIQWEGGVKPQYITYLVPFRESHQFLLCADENLHCVNIKDQFKIDYSIKNAHTKPLNMCEYVKENLVFTCSREPYIKLWDRHDLKAEYKGHTMSVTSVACCGEKMASGGRDQTVRIWDVETAKELSQRKIERNVVTGVKWIPDNLDLFVQLSEDLTMRLWDIRQKPFKPA